MFIQTLVLNEWASTSSSGLPEYSGLNGTNSYANLLAEQVVVGIWAVVAVVVVVVVLAVQAEQHLSLFL